MIISLHSSWLFISKWMRHSALTSESSMQWSCTFCYGPLPIWDYCDDTWQVQSKTLSSDEWGNFYYMPHIYKIQNFNSVLIKYQST